MLSIENKLKHSTDREILQHFFTACSKNNLNDVIYIIKNHKFDIQTDSNMAIRTACMYGSLDVLKYFYKEFQNKIDIHTNNDAPLKMAARMQKYELIEYLIFEKNIQETTEITRYLKDNKNKIVSSMFAARNLKKQLNLDFGCEHTKIKI